MDISFIKFKRRIAPLKSAILLNLPLYGTLQYCTFGINEKEALCLLPFFYLLVYLYSALAYYTVAFFLLPIISIKSYKL